jgi:hypothetical protein
MRRDAPNLAGLLILLAIALVEADDVLQAICVGKACCKLNLALLEQTAPYESRVSCFAGCWSPS